MLKWFFRLRQRAIDRGQPLTRLSLPRDVYAALMEATGAFDPCRLSANTAVFMAAVQFEPLTVTDVFVTCDPA
ncbi:MAG: hypothetical protein V3W44_09790 [Dehalococcoidales bacterium]